MRQELRIRHADSSPQPARRLLSIAMRRDLAFLVLAAPAVLYIIVFKYLTMFGVVIAFKDYRVVDGILNSPWNGWRNFEVMFASPKIWEVTRTTLLMNALFITVGTLAAIGLALLIFEVFTSRFTRLYQTTLFFPQFISWVIVSYFVYALLSTDSGLINSWLRTTGMKQVGWYSNPQYWPIILLLASIWKSVGSGSLLYLAAMLGIDPQYYEAARLDGATKWQEVRYITLPLIAPVIIINLLLAIGGILGADFGLFYQVPRDQAQLYATTDVIDTYVFRLLRENSNVAQSAAVGLYQSVAGFFLVLLANWLVRRHDPERSLF